MFRFGRLVGTLCAGVIFALVVVVCLLLVLLLSAARTLSPPQYKQ
jgi:hypothetical protein